MKAPRQFDLGVGVGESSPASGVAGRGCPDEDPEALEMHFVWKDASMTYNSNLL